MTKSSRIFCFFLILNLFLVVFSDHHQHKEGMKRGGKPLSIQQFQEYVKQGIPIIDTRHMPQNGIIKGSYWTSENGNVTQLVSFVLKPDSQFVVVSSDPNNTEIIERLEKAGFKNMIGYNAFDIKEWKGQDLIKSQIKKLQQMDKAMKQMFIDVRSQDQLRETGKFRDSLWIPITQLQTRINEVEDYMKKHAGSQFVIHCRGGPRARLGASMIMNRGLGPITVLNERIDMLRDMLVPFGKDQL